MAFWMKKILKRKRNEEKGLGQKNKNGNFSFRKREGKLIPNFLMIIFIIFII